MRVVILLDRPFARRERRMLSRLEIGLADEGLRVIHAVPMEILRTEPVGLYSHTVGYEPAGFPVSLRFRANQLVASLRDAVDDGYDQAIDLVHIWSPDVWRLGLEVASQLDAAATMEVWSTAAVARLGERLNHPVRPAVTVGDAQLARTIRAKYPTATIHDTLWGVHGEVIERPPPTADRALALLMLVDGSNPAFLDAALRGLASICRRDERVMAFVNTERAQGHVVWKLVRRLNLSDRVSLIPDAEARREAILNLDGLIIAEPGGRLRSMALDAMACGMPVIAAVDPALGIFTAGVTARLVARPDAAEWESAINSIVSGSEEIEHLRRAAADWVVANRAASAHVSSVLRVYEAILRAKSEAPTPVRAA
jgi:hypothetical protein